MGKDASSVSFPVDTVFEIFETLLKYTMSKITITAFIALSLITVFVKAKEINQHIDINNRNVISVVENGIKNDGTPINTELNELVRSSYGKTLFFPAGVYNLSEPMVLPFDYTKNVNIIFDKNATIRSDKHLEALLKIGFSEMSTPDRSYRHFSYIEGGLFDCSNADNGIIVNGLKQLVSLKSISLFKGRHTHISVKVTDDFKGTGSSDTKIDNITIQGISSNEEVCGIFIDKECHDIKISNTFIYGTKYGIVTKSGGHILNNIHILSQVTTGGTNLGEKNFLNTEGIRIETDDFYILHEIYFDTVDKCIVIAGDKSPVLVIDKNIYYSYLDNFGDAFISRNGTSAKQFQAKISNSIFHIRKKGYRIFDIDPLTISNDINNNLTFINNTIRNAHFLNPFDGSLSQKIRGKYSDVLVSTGQKTDNNKWYVLGSLLPSPYRNSLRLDLSHDHAIELEISYNEGKAGLLRSNITDSEKKFPFTLGYVIKDNYCVLLLKSEPQSAFSPFISDLTGLGAFMATPSKDRYYHLSDYQIEGKPKLLFINNDKE